MVSPKEVRRRSREVAPAFLEEQRGQEREEENLPGGLDDMEEEELEDIENLLGSDDDDDDDNDDPREDKVEQEDPPFHGFPGSTDNDMLFLLGRIIQEWERKQEDQEQEEESGEMLAREWKTTQMQLVPASG